MNLKRYSIRLAYNGGKYHGWQRQLNAHSVQEEIESTLSKLYGQQHYGVIGCGRTDTGVHAKDFVLHVDLPDTLTTERLKFKLNRMLSDDIVIFEVAEAAPEFHARFDAKKRTYRYFIHRQKDPFRHEQSLYVPGELDMSAMNEAAKHFLGKQDFTSLSKLHTDVNNNFCEVYGSKWVEEDESRAYFEISANRFLRNMVRATVGILLDVGQGRTRVEEVPKILEAKDRQAASTSVAAKGLFLWEIEY